MSEKLQKLGSSKEPPGKLLLSSVFLGGTDRGEQSLKNKGKTDGLPRARADLELLAVSRSLKS